MRRFCCSPSRTSEASIEEGGDAAKHTQAVEYAGLELISLVDMTAVPALERNEQSGNQRRPAHLLYLGLLLACAFYIGSGGALHSPEVRADEPFSTQARGERLLYTSSSVPTAHPGVGTGGRRASAVSIKSISSLLGSNIFKFFRSLFKPRPVSPCSLSYAAPPPLPGKKGAAFPLRDAGQSGSWIENLPKVILLKPHWNYSWGSKRIDAQPADIEFVPMIWGGNNAAYVQQSLTDVESQIASGKSHRLLGFNEPDQTAQSNMLVPVALERWSLLESANIPLVSPSCAQPAGNWMTAFMGNATSSCKRVDWVGVHWYGGANFDSFVNRMTQFHDLYGRPLLVTEFAPADFSATTVGNNKFTRAAVLAFMKRALPWMEAQDWIAGYAWFAFDITTPVGTSSSLINAKGELTALGAFYESVRADNPQGDQSIAPDP